MGRVMCEVNNLSSAEAGLWRISQVALGGSVLKLCSKFVSDHLSKMFTPFWKVFLSIIGLCCWVFCRIDCEVLITFFSEVSEVLVNMAKIDCRLFRVTGGNVIWYHIQGVSLENYSLEGDLRVTYCRWLVNYLLCVENSIFQESKRLQ